MARLVALFIVALLVTAQVPAQEITGNLEGWILGAEAEPLSNVTVSVQSSSLQGLRGTSTNEIGYFRLVALPVGRYIVEIAHVAHHHISLENVSIELGKTTTLGRLSLLPKTIEMSPVAVTMDRPVVDVTRTATGLNLEYEEVDLLPVDRDFHSLVSLGPGANASHYGDGANISGSTGWENQYYVEGVNVTHPNNASGGASLPYNFISAMQVKKSGYEAEYGGALGGVVNVITHSGGNEFSGTAFGFFTNNRLGGERRSGVVSSNVNSFSFYDAGLSLSGPIVEDNLWFYAAYNPTFAVEDIVIPQLGTFKDRLVSHIFAGKLTWRASDRTSLVFSASGAPSRHNQVYGGNATPQAAILNDDVVRQRWEGGNLNFSLNAKSLISNNTLIELSAAHVRVSSLSQGETERGRSEPRFVDAETGTWSGGVGFHQEQTPIRNYVSAKGTFFLGDHTIKTGVEYEDNATKFNSYTIGPGNTIGGLGLIIRLSDSLYNAFSVNDNVHVRNRIPAIFIQDGWQISPRLLVQLGMRWSAEYLVGSDGKVAQAIKDEFQPRVGFVFQPGELGSQKIYGSYGRYYEKIPTSIVHSYHSTAQLVGITFRHNPLENPTGGHVFINLGSITPSVDDLQGQHVDEFTLGYERVIGERLRMGIHGTYRTIGQIIEDAYHPDLGRWVIGNPGKGNLSILPEPKREYWALELSLEKTSPTGLNFLAAYTLSRSFGNYDGLFSQDYGGTTGPNTSPLYDFMEQAPNSTGLLPNDRTHVFKVLTSYRFPFGLSLGSTFTWQSGTPLNEFGAIRAAPLYFAFLQERGSAGRTPSLWDLSLRISYNALMFSSSVSSKLILDLLHIGNPRKAVTFDQRHYWAVDANGNQFVENFSYLSPTRFQSPFTVRFGMEIGF